MNPLIVALDVADSAPALQLVERLSDRVGYFKVGLQLFTAAGPEIVRQIRGRGGRVFLDLKLHDIPNTVAQAALSAARLGVEMMTLHTLGGREMMERTASLLEEQAEREGWAPPRLLGVTILTSLDQQGLRSAGIDRSVEDMVLLLARAASQAGLPGVVCSPLELQLLREAGLPLIKVTPGIRSSQAGPDDQARTLSAGEAVLRGADFLVVGRPITRAADPASAAESLLEEIHRAKMTP